MERTFEWIDLPDGRARFAGEIRGWDERGHEVYALDLDGRIRYGEISGRFSADGLYVEIKSFGYGQKLDVGIPGASEPVKQSEVDRIKNLLRGLIMSVDAFPDEEKPLALTTFGNATFSGDVVFDAGWITVADA